MVGNKNPLPAPYKNRIIYFLDIPKSNSDFMTMLTIVSLKWLVLKINVQLSMINDHICFQNTMIISVFKIFEALIIKWFLGQLIIEQIIAIRRLKTF